MPFSSVENKRQSELRGGWESLLIKQQRCDLHWDRDQNWSSRDIEKEFQCVFWLKYLNLIIVYLWMTLKCQAWLLLSQNLKLIQHSSLSLFKDWSQSQHRINQMHNNLWCQWQFLNDISEQSRQRTCMCKSDVLLRAGQTVWKSQRTFNLQFRVYDRFKY